MERVEELDNGLGWVHPARGDEDESLSGISVAGQSVATEVDLSDIEGLPMLEDVDAQQVLFGENPEGLLGDDASQQPHHRSDIEGDNSLLPSDLGSTEDEGFSSSDSISKKEGPYSASVVEKAKCLCLRRRSALTRFYERLGEFDQYRRKRGPKVPQRCKLGSWVNKMRQEKKRFDKGERSFLDEEKIKKLNKVGFDWGTHKGRPNWEKHFKNLEKYQLKHGHCNVPTKNHKEDRSLGRWVSSQRHEYKKWKVDKTESTLDEEKIALLEKLGFRWNMLTATPV